LFTNISAPAAPVAGGKARVYVDSGTGMLSVRATGVTTPAITVTPSQFSGFWVNGLDNAGNLQYIAAQFSNLSGSATNAQLPAFTGDVTKPAGSGVQTLANIPTATPAAGTIVFTQQAAAGTPSAGTTVVWGDNTTGHLRSRAPSGVFYSTAQSASASASQWLNSFNPVTGAFTQTQPAFTDISGVATSAQLPKWFTLQWVYAIFSTEGAATANQTMTLLGAVADSDYRLTTSTVSTWGFNAPHASTSQVWKVAILQTAMTGSGTWSLSFFKNGSSVATITTQGTSPTDASTTTSVSVSAGDRVGVRYTSAGSLGAGTLVYTVVGSFLP
jgi:hypothetical protein